MTPSIPAAATDVDVRSPMPRPEFPRPDWQRSEWLNLNGAWSFRFDPDNRGFAEAWQNDEQSAYDLTIAVPFSWASPLSGIGDNRKGVGWYRRTLSWNASSAGSRLFLRFGAVDYTCDVWINGRHVGSHQGGYGTFEFEVTDVWRNDSDNAIVVRAEDNDHAYQTRGKQGYGEIRGIWQPVWLEARPDAYIGNAKFVTSISGRVEAAAKIFAARSGAAALSFDFGNGSVRHVVGDIRLEAGENEILTSFEVSDPQLWSPENPYLYEGKLVLSGNFGEDAVSTYFGIREVGTARFGERDYKWITLNGKPVYLNGTLDQSFNPTGFFTYPSDDEMRNEIYLMKRLGLNFVRIHIKSEEPRKLYWADKLGLLVMQDIPCYWGNPDETARAAHEKEELETIERDYNHPSIISWVIFNETWGLKTQTDSSIVAVSGDYATRETFLPDTQEWVRERYRWAKRIDPTRIIEDNSPCLYDHVESDLNTWHFYMNGYEQVRSHIEDVVSKTYAGSTFNYIGGNVQSDAPLMNSECGNVWGMEGGAGDSDLAWHYRYMLNEYRRHDKMCGFIFTEFRDVTNEWNGYYRLDGSDKDFGYDGLVPGMTIADLHSPDFVVIDAPPCQTVDAGSFVTVALLRSSYSDRYHGRLLRLEWEIRYDGLDAGMTGDSGSRQVEWDGYGVAELEPVTVRMPGQDAIAVLAVRLVDGEGAVIMRNFVAFDVRSGRSGGDYGSAGHVVSVPVADFTEHSFAYQWNAIQGHKANGGESGAFVYEVNLPDAEDKPLIGLIEILFEASSKRLLSRNRAGETDMKNVNFMHGEFADPERNPNSYLMTGDRKHESRVNVLIDGEQVGSIVLQDNPADSRGILSWHYQPVHNKLDEAGSYGYMCKVVVPSQLAAKLDRSRRFTLQLQADDGGLALYGRNAGRYPIDIVVRCR